MVARARDGSDRRVPLCHVPHLRCYFCACLLSEFGAKNKCGGQSGGEWGWAVGEACDLKMNYNTAPNLRCPILLCEIASAVKRATYASR